MSKLKQLASHTAIYGLGHIMSKGFYFVFLVPYLTRRLEDTYSFGVYNELYGYSTLLIVLFSFRMDTALFRYGSKTGSLAKAFSTALVPIVLGGIVMVSLIYSSAGQIGTWLAYPDKAFYIKWFALIIGFDVLMLLPYARLRLENKALLFTGYRLLNIILTIGFVFYFLEIKPEGEYGIIPSLEDVEYVFLANLITSSVMLILMLPILAKARLSQIDKHVIRQMLAYCAPLVIVGVANSINQFFGVPIQKFFLGGDYADNLSDGGLYAGPQKIAGLVSLVTVAFNYAAEPFFFKHAANSEDRSIYGKIALAFTLFMGAVIVGIVSYLEILKHLTDVSKYEDGFVVVPILLFAYFFLGLYYNISIWYKLSDKTRYGAYISIVGVILTLTLSIILLPKIGFIASAWAALACYLVMVSLAYLFGQRHYQIDYPIWSMTKILLFLIVFVFIALQVNGMQVSVPIKLAINTGVFLCYIGLAYLTNRRFVHREMLGRVE